MLSTLSVYFIGDDFGLIQLFSHKPPLHFLTLFTNSWVEGIYGANADELRPLVELSYQIDSLWGPGNPFGYHVGSIALHTANALLVLAIARRLVGLPWVAATFAGMAFALLPVQAEVGAWISGRADSIPAVFYLGTLLTFGLWRGSKSESRWTGWLLLGTSIGLFFAALFSKQSAITMLGTLIAYDVLVERRLPWAPWRTLVAYVPFLLLTVGYLGLRYLLFGNAVRENQIVGETFVAFGIIQATYLQMVATGSHVLRTDGPWPALALVGLGAALLAVPLALPAVIRGRAPTWLGPLLYFGPTWWLITVAPLAVTYVSGRHLYLTAAGFAIVLGIAFAALWSAPVRAWRWGAVVVSVTLLLYYATALHAGVEEWNLAGARSQRMAQDIWRESAPLPPGSLVVYNAPISNAPIFKWRGIPALAFPDEALATEPHRPAWTFIWAWVAPFIYGPPFAPPDVQARVTFVEPPGVYCCPPEEWLGRTQATIAAWQAQPAQPPVVVLTWDHDGKLVRASDTPRVRQGLARVLEATNPDQASDLLQAVFRAGATPDRP